MKKPVLVLFVCRANRNRSPTAEQVFGEMLRDRGHAVYDPVACPSGHAVRVDSAGYDADEDAQQLDQELLDAATFVFALDPDIAGVLRKRYRIRPAKKLHVLHVPDVYQRGFPDLVDILREQLSPFCALIK